MKTNKSEVDIFKKLAELEDQKRKIEEQIEATRTMVMAEMTSKNVEKVEADYGKFYFTVRKIWKYSTNVKVASDNLKELQQQEQAEGIATFEEKKVLTFKAE